MTTESKRAQAAYLAAVRKAELLLVKRDEAVRKDLADGLSQSQVGRETGLTRGRVNQISKEPPDRWARILERVRAGEQLDTVAGRHGVTVGAIVERLRGHVMSTRGR
jgi:hypothetical protein